MELAADLVLECAWDTHMIQLITIFRHIKYMEYNLCSMYFMWYTIAAALHEQLNYSCKAAAMILV